MRRTEAKLVSDAHKKTRSRMKRLIARKAIGGIQLEGATEKAPKKMQMAKT